MSSFRPTYKIFSRGTDDLKLISYMKYSSIQSLPTRKKKKGICLMSFPFDEGTMRNGGYLGAANGPTIFRQHLFKIGSLNNPEFGINLSDSCELYDLGDIHLEKNYCTLENAHLKLRESVRHIVGQGYIPFIVGGSNDQSFPNAMGLIDTIVDTKDIGVVNLDAHLDVKLNVVH